MNGMMVEYMLSGFLIFFNMFEILVVIYYYYEVMVLFFSIIVGNMVLEYSF